MTTLFEYASNATRNVAGFLIEPGIPVTSDRAGRRNAKYTKPDILPVLRKMQPGDSFVVRPSDCGGAPLIVTQNIVTGIISQFKSEFAPEVRPSFTTRQQGGRWVRVWRTT